MNLLKSIRVGNNILKKSMVKAPVNRSRADTNGVVGDYTVTNYSQRVRAGLILSEAIYISKRALGSPPALGIYTTEQITA